MNDAQRELAAALTESPRGEVRGPFLPLMHHPDLGKQVKEMGDLLRWRRKLPEHLAELAILITARRWTCQYEWYAHEKIARKAGLDPRIIEELAANGALTKLPPDEAVVYAFCSETHATGHAGDSTFEAARLRFGLEGVLELVALCGHYTHVAMVLNTAEVALPEGVTPPLKPL